MDMSKEIDKIAPALVAIQGKMTVVKDADGVVKSGKTLKYAELSTILETIRPSLESEGLTITYSFTEEGTSLTTRILHASGQWIDSTIPVSTKGLTPQQMGGAISYFRRYGVCAALNVATPGEDDDAEKMEKAYTKAEEKEAIAADLRKFQAAILPRLAKYDAEAVQLAFEENGFISEEEDKEKMICELIKQVNSKEKLTVIGQRCKALQLEVESSNKVAMADMEL